jgi:hypothetical protein
MARAQVTIPAKDLFVAPLDVFVAGWLMWCHAITAGSRRDAKPQTPGVRTMNWTIEIIDDLMCVMDDDGNGYDAATLTSYRDAKQQIQKWAAEYTINVADAYRQLADYFSKR